MTSFSLLITLCLLSTGAFFALSESKTPQEKPEAIPREGSEIKRAIINERIQAQVQVLQKESLQQSLEKLAIPEMYYWPGTFIGAKLPPPWFPLVPEVGQYDVDTILSNRRFLKVYHGLSILPKDQAAKLLKEHIGEGAKSQKKILEFYMKALLPVAKEGRYVDIPVALTERESPTLHGWRLKVFALILIAGNQEAAELYSEIAEVVREGRRHYQALQADLGVMAVVMVWRDSLYNRQILATGLMKTAPDTPEAEAVRKKYANRWKTIKLTRYDAEYSVYDFPTSRGFINPDYSKGTLTMHYLDKLSDEEFDHIVKTLLPVNGK